MRKYLSQLLRQWADKLYTEPIPETPPPPKRIGLIPSSIVRRGKKIRKNTCLTSLKKNRTEQEAKSLAEASTYPKLRAYKCPFCDSWHLTKQINKLTLH